MVIWWHKGSASRAKWQEKTIFSCISEAPPTLPEEQSQQGIVLLFCNIAQIFFQQLEKRLIFAVTYK